MGDYITREEHAELHRMGEHVDFSGREPEACVSGFSQTGNDTRPAPGNHSHSVKLSLQHEDHETVEATMTDGGVGTMYLNDVTKSLWVRFSDGWQSIVTSFSGQTYTEGDINDVVFTAPNSGLWLVQSTYNGDFSGNPGIDEGFVEIKNISPTSSVAGYNRNTWSRWDPAILSVTCMSFIACPAGYTIRSTGYGISGYLGTDYFPTNEQIELNAICLAISEA